nr:NSP1-253-UG [synthetic construct]
MATFKDACFHYRRLTALNRRLCNIGANSIWMPVPDAKIKGWCLECCQIADLTHCYGCSLPHVCKWCVQNRRCFLDNEPHLLKLRTVKHPITKDKLQCIIDLYNIIFPINDKVIRKFERMIKQRECRNQYKIEWYNHLLLPITLNAAAFKFDENNLYYVFGLYEKSVSDIYAPYRIVNFINEFDKLLLDHINFTRMSNLPIELRNHYAKKYFQLSRLPSSKLKQIYFSDFTKETVIFNTYTKTPGRSIYRNVTEDYKDHDGDYKDHDIDYKDDDDKASVEKFVGTWKIADSHNFGEYLKAIGAPKELSDGGDATTPTLYISQKDGDKMTVKIENGPPTFLDTQVKFKLGEEFDEFPSDRRKGVKSVVNLVGEKLVYVQKWDGKETTYVREIKDGKLVVTLTMGDVVAVRSYRRATE